MTAFGKDSREGALARRAAAAQAGRRPAGPACPDVPAASLADGMALPFAPSFALRTALVLVCALVLACVPACGGGSGGGAASGGASAASEAPAGEPATGAAYAAPSSVAEPQPSPDAGGAPYIDADHVSAGYVSAQAASPARLKFQVTRGDQTYNYDMPNDGSVMFYPINMESGSYSFRIMQNTSGSNYVELLSESAEVALANEFDPFLLPNMFCSYDASSACVGKAREIAAASSNQGEVVESICTYVAANVSYDNAKAEQLASSTGYVPDPDETLSTGRGICFDYASLSAAMLRSMGIPTKVMTGYVGADQVYHSWIMVYVDGSWQTAQFSVNPNTWSRCDVTFASTGSTKYVGDASAYTDKYTY